MQNVFFKRFDCKAKQKIIDSAESANVFEDSSSVFEASSDVFEALANVFEDSSNASEESSKASETSSNASEDLVNAFALIEIAFKATANAFQYFKNCRAPENSKVIYKLEKNSPPFKGVVAAASADGAVVFRSVSI